MNTSIKCAKIMQSGLEKDNHSLQLLVDLKVGYGIYTLIPEVIQAKPPFPEWDVKITTYKRTGSR